MERLYCFYNYFKLILKYFCRRKFFLLGFFALLWYLVRTIPKPSRATYPCQRAAFPLASAFVIWLAGSLVSFFTFKKVKIYFKRTQYWYSLLFLLLTTVVFTISQFRGAIFTSYAMINSSTSSYRTAVVNRYHISQFDSIISPISKVSIVKSLHNNATDITYDDIKAMVRKAVALSGGLDGLIKNGDVVVLKPNLVVTFLDSPVPLYLTPEVNGVTTDWRIVKATVELVRELNPDGKVYVAEGSADESTKTNFTRMKYTPENIPGVDGFIAFEESGKWEEWNSPNLVSVRLPAGKGLYPNNLKPNKSDEFYLNKTYYQADVLINLPVLKNHKDAGITCAIKNVGIGATPQNIYGGKAGTNARWWNQRINHEWDNLHRWIHDFYLCRPTDFVIIDGLQGLTDGPCGGWKTLDKIQQNMRLILASKDALAIDAVSALIMGFDPEKIPYLTYLAKDSVGCINPRYIRVEGKKVHEVRKIFAFTYTNVSGQVARNYNFTSPTLSVENYKISPDSLVLRLNVSDQVTKIEIALDDVLLDSIFVAKYDHIVVKTNRLTLNPKQVKIYAYDRFLNCSSVYLDGTPANVSNIKTDRKYIKIYPNPAIDCVNIQFEEFLKKPASIYIYNSAGKLVTKNHSIQTNSKIDISSLPKGIYLLIIFYNDTVEQTKITKILKTN